MGRARLRARDAGREEESREGEHPENRKRRLQAVEPRVGVRLEGGVLQLVTDQSISGITAGFDTFITAISIAYGLMVSTVVMPRRFTRFAPYARP